MNIHSTLPLAFTFDPSNGAAQFWVGVASIMITLVGAPTLWSFYVRIRRKQGKQISYRIMSDVGLLNDQKDLGEDVKLMVDGYKVNDARMVMVQVANTGTEPVKSADFEGQPICFDFDPPSLIRCAIHDTKPDTLIPQDHLKSFISLDGNGQQGLGNNKPQGSAPEFHGFVGMPVPLLNPGNSINLKFLMQGRANMNVRGHYAGGEVELYTPPPQLITARRVVAAILIAFLVGLMLNNGLGLIHAFLQGNCGFSFSPVIVSGSTAFYSQANTERGNYQASCPIALLSVESSTSGAGLRSLETGDIQIANSEGSPQEFDYDYSDLLEHQVAVIVFAIIINKNITGVSSLSSAQITEIYNGTISNWSEVGGPNRPITLIGRPTDSGTYAAFKRFITNGQDNSRPLDESSTQGVVDDVKKDSGGIGYVDLGSASKASGDVTILNIDGNAPTPGLVENNSYHFWAIERMYTRRDANKLSLSFIDYVTRDIRTTDTFIQLTDMSNAALATHK